jgi:hypothetical protein
MGGGGGGQVGTGRNNMDLSDRPLSGVPWPSGPGTNPYTGFNPGTPTDFSGAFPAGMPNVADTSAGAYFGSTLGAGDMANMGRNLFAANLPGSDMAPYMTPWTQNVIDRTMTEMNRQQDIDRIGIEDRAIGAGAYGGSRHGVADAMLDRQWADKMGDKTAELNMMGFQNAQDQQRYYSGLGSQTSMQGLDQLANLSNLGFGMGRQLSQDQMAAGAMQRELVQNLIDAAKGQYGQYADWPAQSYAFQSILPQIGNAGTTHTQQETPFNPLGAITGLMGMLLKPF